MGRLAGGLERLEDGRGRAEEGRWILAGGGRGIFPRGADSMANGMAEVESSRSWQSAELAYKLPPPAISPGSSHPGGAASSYLCTKSLVKCINAKALRKPERKQQPPSGVATV